MVKWKGGVYKRVNMAEVKLLYQHFPEETKEGYEKRKYAI
jgi:hypothetical protein